MTIKPHKCVWEPIFYVGAKPTAWRCLICGEFVQLVQRLPETQSDP